MWPPYKKGEMSEDPIEPVPETVEAPAIEPAEAAAEEVAEPPPPKPRAKAKPRARKEPIIDALPAEAPADPELPPSPPELVREPSKRKKAAPKPKAAAGLSEAPPKRAKKVQLPHEVQMADTTEPPFVPAPIAHGDLHSMFRQYLGNHKIITQQAKQKIYNQ